MKRALLVALAALLCLPAGANHLSSPFSVRAEPLDARTILVRLDIPSGHAVYANKVRLELPAGWSLKSRTEPSVEDDPVAGREYLWRSRAEVVVVGQAGTPLPESIDVVLQGCSEAAQVCFPPERQRVPVGP